MIKLFNNKMMINNNFYKYFFLQLFGTEIEDKSYSRGKQKKYSEK